MDMAEKGNASIDQDWLVSRQAAVELAIERDDLPALRRWSVEPGGFGNAAIRQKAWSYLLRDKPQAPPDPHLETSSVETSTHSKEDGQKRSPDPADTAAKPHSDEGQVLLDTKRSFVYYPENISPREKLRLQGELNDLIVTVLRRRRGLSYFQGYHDIISILYLTFYPYQNEEPLRRRSASPRQPRSRKRSKASETRPAGIGEGRRGSVDRLAQTRTTSSSPIIQGAPLPDIGQIGQGRTSRASSGQSTPIGEPTLADIPVHRKQETEQWSRLVDCCDAVSLLKVRDAMGSTLSPSIGYLRLFKRLIKATDPELAKLVLGVSPTPYFALSWLLTVFSHDLNVLEPTQRIFDFFISRNPAIMIYLGVAIIMLKRKTLIELKDTLETDPGILHSYLSRLPPLIADNPAGEEEAISIEKEAPGASTTLAHDYLESGGPNPLEAVRLSELFSLTDTLWARFPLDHSAIRAHEILASKSVIFTDNDAGESLSKADAAALVGEAGFGEDEVVVTPAMPETDDEEDEPQRPARSRRRRTSILEVLGGKHTRVAIAVVVVGVSFAFYNARRQGRPHSLMLDIIRARLTAEIGEVGAFMRERTSSSLLRVARNRLEEALKQITWRTTR